MDAIKKDDLAELLLAALYEKTEEFGHSNCFLSIDEIAANLGINDHGAVVEAARLLEERALILMSLDHGGALNAFMTPEGIAFIEERGETGIIGEYKRYRSFIGNTTPATEYIPPAMPNITFEPAPVPQKVKGASNENVSHVIASMNLLIKNDPLLTDDLKEDLVSDIKTLEIQLSKNHVNERFLDMILANLRELPSLSPLLDLLLSMK